MNEINMDLPVNFPLGTRFWQLIFDAVADLTNGKFTLVDALAEKLSMITERAERDPEFKKAMRLALAKNDVGFKLCEQIAWAVLRNAPDHEDRREVRSCC